MAKRSTTNIYTSRYELRLDPEQKSRLQTKANAAGVDLADAFRIGAEQYLDNLTGSEGTGDLLAEFRALGARIENRLSDGR